MKERVEELRLGDQTVVAKAGKIAKQASGAVTLQFGDTLVLATVCVSKDVREGQDFFPLTVDYSEKAYAGGVIPGGFFKREGRATEKEILTARLTDRPIRPLFPKGFFNEVQVMTQVLCSDGINEPDIISVNATSLALLLSDAPFLGPVGCVRVAEVNGDFVINPSYEQISNSTLDLVLAGTVDGVTMIESEAKEINEERMVQALEFGFEYIKQLCAFQSKFIEGIAAENMAVCEVETDQELVQKIIAVAKPEYENNINQPKAKHERDAAIKELNAKLVEQFVTEDNGVTAEFVKEVSHDVEAETVRELTLEARKRVDGRNLDEIRDISCEINYLPRTHGSALFTRGQTQSLGVVTLGTSRDEQMIESYEGMQSRRFMLHYNFPAFSVGECKPNRGPGRREVGHGKLAWRGLNAVIPSKEVFPYTIRLVSEILESNGSSSMATICSGSLALMDAGIPISAPVSGIAMGLIKDGDRWAVLSDIAGVEDHLGDMDFKVAGTAKGITTLQLDIKLKEGLDFSILVKALEQAKQGRSHILDCMNKVIQSPKKELSTYAPQVTEIQISVDKISELIGPGGKMIRKITAESGAEVEIDDSGKVKVTSRNAEDRDKALGMIRDITKDAEVGKVYQGTVKRIMPFGAFCEIFPGREGLCHVSELSDSYVKNVEDVVKVGDPVQVKVIEIDKQGRVNLSIKQASKQPAPDKQESAA